MEYAMRNRPSCMRIVSSSVAIGRQIALLRHLAADFGVLVIVEVVAVGVEDAVAAQAKRLVNLEIETNRRHVRQYSPAIPSSTF